MAGTKKYAIKKYRQGVEADQVQIGQGDIKRFFPPQKLGQCPPGVRPVRAGQVDQQGRGFWNQ